MTILVLCPMETECINFSVALNNFKIIDGSLHTSEVKDVVPHKVRDTHNAYIVKCCGVGKTNAAAECAKNIWMYNPELVAVIGYAAGDSNFTQGDIVVPSDTVYNDIVAPEGFVPELQKPYQLFGEDEVWIATGDRFVNGDFIDGWVLTHPGKKWLFDMETAAIAHTACKMSVPTICLKMVSDVPQLGHNVESFSEFVNSHKDFTKFIEYLENRF